MPGRIVDGVYDVLVSEALAEALEPIQRDRKALEDLDVADSHERLTRHVSAELQRVLRAFPEKHRLEAQVELVNRLLGWLREQSNRPELLTGAELTSPPERLLAVHAPPAPPARPVLSLASSALLTRAAGEPRLGAELVAEVASADRVDMLVSFVKWAGWRRLAVAFEPFANAGKKLRLLTTTYMGASDAEALDAIARLPGAEVRVSFDTRRTRLHAKAWLFERATGFSSVYVGSANVSVAALDTGLEWVLKASESESRHIVDKFRGAFESLWADEEFVRYDPDDPAQVERLRRSLDVASGRRADPALFFDLKPHPFQEAILEKLRVEREQGFARNLVVAATGTGKTMVAAFDYAAVARARGTRPRLLFVAHRQEILEQSLLTFRAVLRDQDFGDLLAGGSSPRSHEHLFATIQSLESRRLVDAMGPEFWSYVVFDECHHAAARSYERALETLRPEILLGLTATPERADGEDILHWFDGRMAAELRLWEAIEKQHLAPFEYYGLHDGVSLEKVRWVRGGYDLAQLDGLYTGHDARAELVIEQLRRIHGHPAAARGLGFCVSVKHAEFMARKFEAAGIPAMAVHGGSEEEERAEVKDRLRRGEVAFVFTCDLYNEGVDLPFVDTILLLRPTESATLFLQQLGRGLRRSEGKQSALVLDFIGQAHERFRFDAKLSAMTGVPRGRLAQAVGENFPTLPSGCHLQLERVAREIVLQNLQAAISAGPELLVRELREAARERPEITLAEFLEVTGRQVEDVYRSSLGWTPLRARAGLIAELSDTEARTSVRLRKLLHVDEPDRLRTFRAVAAGEPLHAADRTRALMLGRQLFDAGASSVEDLLAPLSSSRPLRQELGELCELLDRRVELASLVTPLPHAWPLAVHRTYSRAEVMAAIGKSTPRSRYVHQAGVLAMEDERVELFFVTLDKSSKRFTPTTAYEDYAISPRQFHWQSQNHVTPESRAGQRYIHGAAQGWRFLLFVRPTPADAFMFLGPARYLKHERSKPMSITWELEFAIPPRDLARYATLLAA